MPKRRVFISFDHDDTDKVNGFLGLRNIIDSLEFYNHKLDHEIQGQSDEYKKRVIRERYIKPASVCVVLFGNAAAKSDWIAWEIGECLRQKMGILAIRLNNTHGEVPGGVPSGHVGDWQPDKFVTWIEWAYQQREQ